MSNSETIDGWLREQIEFSDTARRQSRRFASNSYGAGYDQGRYDGLQEALAELLELWSAAVTRPDQPHSENKGQ